MACQRLIQISESVGSSGSSGSGNPFFSSDSSGSPKFFIGDMSDDDGDDCEDKNEVVEGMMAIPQKGSFTVGLLKLSPPSSKLAERRRKVRFNSVSLSSPSP